MASSSRETSEPRVQHISGVTATGGAKVFVGSNTSNIYNINQEPELHIFNTSNYQSYKDINAFRVPNTCLWFLEHPNFIRWKDSDKSDLLWLTADPGCGKSVLSRALVDERAAGGESLPTFHFFFKDNDEQNTACQAMCALLHQLFCRNEPLFHKHAVSAVKRNGPRLVTQFESLWQLFLAAATDPQAGQIVCILDALDECRQEDRDKIIEKLQDFYLKSASQSSAGLRLKFFVTSRPYHQIELRFFQLTKHFPAIRLAGEEESNAISDEISLVVKARVAEIGEEKNLAESVEKSLEKRLLEISNRTYLWLRVIWDEIRDAISTTEKKLLKVVEQLPETVEQAYEQLLAKCKQKEQARRVLHIILAAQRPLTLSELDVALEIQAGSKSYKDLDLEGDETRKTQIRTLCGLFVSIVDSKVYLIHQTAKEFLLRRNDEELALTGWRHSFDLQKSHNVLAQICVTHLCFNEFKENPLSGHPDLNQCLDHEQCRAEQPKQAIILLNFSARYALLDYSANHWIAHFREASEIVEDDLLSSASKFCDIGNGQNLTWFEIFRNSNPSSTYVLDLDQNNLLYKRADGKIKVLALYWAALEGLEQVVVFLLKNGANANTQGGRYGTALLGAAARGHEKVVQLLVQSNADVNIQGGKYRPALTAAAARGHEKIVQFLVQSNADVNIQEEHYGTALQGAAAEGHEKIVQFLVQSNADVNIQGGRCGTALQEAAAGGREKIVQFLVQSNADVNIQGGRCGTALQEAAARGHDKIVQFLVQSNADVNIQGGGHGTALIAAAAGGHEKIVQFLVQSNADVNIQGGRYGTALQGAAAEGHDKIVQFLVQSNADVNIQGGGHGTALIAAAAGGHEKIVQFLVQSNADISLQGKFQIKAGKYIAGDAFHAAVELKKEKVLERLLEADTNDYLHSIGFKKAVQSAISSGFGFGIHQLLNKLMTLQLADEIVLSLINDNVGNGQGARVNRVNSFERFSPTLTRFGISGNWIYVKGRR